MVTSGGQMVARQAMTKCLMCIVSEGGYASRNSKRTGAP
jgi:hypothetical protein